MFYLYLSIIINPSHNRNVYQNIDLEKSYPALFELLWYSQLPCFDVLNITSSSGSSSRALIKSCIWKGETLNCSSIFTMYPTDRGMCCTFNKQKANDMFKQSRYQQQIEYFSDQDKNLSVDDSTTPSWYVNI